MLTRMSYILVRKEWDGNVYSLGGHLTRCSHFIQSYKRLGCRASYFCFGHQTYNFRLQYLLGDRLSLAWLFTKI